MPYIIEVTYYLEAKKYVEKQIFSRILRRKIYKTTSKYSAAKLYTRRGVADGIVDKHFKSVGRVVPV